MEIVDRNVLADLEKYAWEVLKFFVSSSIYIYYARILRIKSKTFSCCVGLFIIWGSGPLKRDPSNLNSKIVLLWSSPWTLTGKEGSFTGSRPLEPE
jgi:hypothetical protein